MPPDDNRIPTPSACVLVWLALSLAGWVLIGAACYFLYRTYQFISTYAP